ncbi:hypothetical protein [Paragemmobacter ruber]|uniref:Uncharacterized protein n=1 Tax=Paragemmobacter ruber TaxID=1985673 RepID=A0ABW9Y8I1_9RHOB|nr:hypothetical protein [Rhodobacter ruber]NBE08119.1 hypothetical protein [Rhodobacter ruber]
MAVFLVTYDLNREVIRPNITKIIRDGFDGFAMLSESSYAIATDLDADDVFAKFSKVLDDNDQLYVITLSKPYYGQGSEQVNKWLDDNLPW